jgi:hypothetical protein
MRPVTGRGLKIERRIWLTIDDLDGGRYVDTPLPSWFRCPSRLTAWCPGNRARYRLRN